MKLLTKWVCVALAVVFSLALFPSIAFADWYDDVSGGSYSPIIGEPYVAETFCSVEARYSLTTEIYQCNELIMRFYREAYSLEVMAYMNIGLKMLTEGYDFATPTVPKKGDIIYSPAKFRQYKSDHWAIVKNYSNGKITLFEQNVKWNGKAGTGRQVKFPSEYYYIYTPVAKPGFPAPVLKGVSESASSTVTAAVPVTSGQPALLDKIESSTSQAAEESTKADVTIKDAAPANVNESSVTAEQTETEAEIQTAQAVSEVLTTAPPTTAEAGAKTSGVTQTSAVSNSIAAENRKASEPILQEDELTDSITAESLLDYPATATDIQAAAITEPETQAQAASPAEPETASKKENNTSEKKYVLIIAGAAAFTLLAAVAVAFAAFKKRR